MFFVFGRTPRQATMRHIRSEGFQAVALNYRGLTSDLKTPKVASAESWADIHEVAQHILKVKPNCELFGLGFSLGGGMLLRHLGFEGERTLFKAAVTVAAPVDFTGACAALESSRRKLFINFMISQGAKAFMLQGLVKSKFRDRVDLKRVLLATRLSQIESALICPLMGYATPAEYYEANNPRPFLHKVSVPTLVVNAEDDPVISLHTLPFDELKRDLEGTRKTTNHPHSRLLSSCSVFLGLEFEFVACNSSPSKEERIESCSVLVSIQGKPADLCGRDQAWWAYRLG